MKLERVFKEWLISHPNIKGTGRYSLRYSTGKVRDNLSSNYLGKFYVSPKGRVFKRIYKDSNLWKEVPYYITVSVEVV